jgi:hypothetical protein
MKRSVGSPDIVTAASAALAPGMTVTAMPALLASRTSFQPGSETSGVPASLTRAIAAPLLSSSRIRGLTFAALWS